MNIFNMPRGGGFGALTGHRNRSGGMSNMIDETYKPMKDYSSSSSVMSHDRSRPQQVGLGIGGMADRTQRSKMGNISRGDAVPGDPRNSQRTGLRNGTQHT